jgi:hypothetical protein
MKSIEKICNNIIKTQAKRTEPHNQEYKIKILAACEQSKKSGYTISPYEIFWMESITK